LRKLRTAPSDVVVEGGQYADRLRQLFEKIHGKPQWADIEGQSPRTDAEEALLQRSGKVIASSSSSSSLLPPGILDLTPLRPANRAAPHSVGHMRVPFSHVTWSCWVVPGDVCGIPPLLARHADREPRPLPAPLPGTPPIGRPTYLRVTSFVTD
jgi:hypothetical protein